MPTIDFKHVAILLAYAVITAVLNLIFSKRSQIDEWCEANPGLAAFAKLLRGIGIDPWTIFQSLVLGFSKKLPDYQKQSLVELKASKRAPSVPPFLGGLLALALLMFGCSGLPASHVPHDVALGYASLSAALEVADTVETAWLDSLEHPTAEQLDHAAAVVGKLKLVRAALTAVHDDFEHGRYKLKTALADLRAVEKLAGIAGVKVPDKIDKALDAATEVLQ